MKMKKSLIAILLSLVFVCTNYIGIFAAEPVSSGGVISIDAQEGVPETGKTLEELFGTNQMRAMTMPKDTWDWSERR